MSELDLLLDALAADPRADHPAWDALWEARPVEALPRVVEIGARAPIAEQAAFWSFVGALAAGHELPDECERAVADAEPHIRAAIAARPRDETIWYLLSAAAAVRGLGLVATALEDFVAGVANAACPGCDADVEVAWEEVDPPAEPLEPLDPVPSEWTEDDATARLLYALCEPHVALSRPLWQAQASEGQGGAAADGAIGAGSSKVEIGRSNSAGLSRARVASQCWGASSR